MGSLEIEHAPVEGDIQSGLQVMPTQCGMSIKTIHLVVGLTGQQRYLNRIEWGIFIFFFSQHLLRC